MSGSRGGAGAAGASRRHSERGSQVLEFAMVLPAIVLLVVVVVHAALLGADLVTAQGVAREAARVAAVGDDGAVSAALAEALGSRPFEIDLEPAGRQTGDLVTATLRMRSRAFAVFGFELWLPARATMRVEAQP